MPTYQYQCTECGDGHEAVQKFTDDALTECPSCQGRLKKVFSAVGIVFKGSGFYRNDSRGSRSTGSSSASSSSGSDSSNSGSSGSGSSGSDSAGSGKSESKDKSGSKDSAKSTASTSAA